MRTFLPTGKNFSLMEASLSGPNIFIGTCASLLIIGMVNTFLRFIPGMSGMKYGDEFATTTASGATLRMRRSSTSVFRLTLTSDFSIMVVR